MTNSEPKLLITIHPNKFPKLNYFWGVSIYDDNTFTFYHEKYEWKIDDKGWLIIPCAKRSDAYYGKPEYLPIFQRLIRLSKTKLGQLIYGENNG